MFLTFKLYIWKKKHKYPYKLHFNHLSSIIYYKYRTENVTILKKKKKILSIYFIIFSHLKFWNLTIFIPYKVERGKTSFQCETKEFKPKVRQGNQAKKAKAKAKEFLSSYISQTQIKTKTQITTCYRHHHHQQQPLTHQQPQYRSNSSPIQTHQPNKPISTNQKNPAMTPKKPTTNNHQPSKPTTTPGTIISHEQTHEPTTKQTHKQPSKPTRNKQTHEQPSSSHEQPTRKKTQPPPCKPTTTPASNHQEKPTKKPPPILLLLI